MSVPRILYLVLAVAGVTLPWYYNLQYMAQTSAGFDFVDFMAAAASNPAARSLSWDLTIACIAGLSWIYFESRRLGLRFFWIYIILTFLVAYAFAFPLFLFVRQGKLEAMRDNPGADTEDLTGDG